MRISVNDILTIDGLVRSAAVEFRLLANFVKVSLTLQKALPFVNRGAPPDWPTQSPARAPPVAKYAPTLDVEIVTIDG